MPPRDFDRLWAKSLRGQLVLFVFLIFLSFPLHPPFSISLSWLRVASNIRSTRARWVCLMCAVRRLWLLLWISRILSINCWFSHDVTKIQTTKLSILLRFYFHGVLEELKTNFQTNFHFKRVLGFVSEYALLRDAAFTWRPRELSFTLKKWLFSRNFAI